MPQRWGHRQAHQHMHNRSPRRRGDRIRGIENMRRNNDPKLPNLMKTIYTYKQVNKLRTASNYFLPHRLSSQETKQEPGASQGWGQNEFLSDK